MYKFDALMKRKNADNSLELSVCGDKVNIG